MGKVFINVGMSLDGFLAGPNRGPKNPLGDGGVDIHKWAFRTRAFLEHLGMEGGETQGHDNEIARRTFDRAGAYILGRRMFDEGESNWPENVPFRAPVFVLTNNLRSPWERKGGTTFYFTNDNIHVVLARTQKAAGNKDVRIGGGASVIRQYLNAGLVEELEVQIAPLFLGTGMRLFDQIDKAKLQLEIVEAVSSPLITHVRYKIAKA